MPVDNWCFDCHGEKFPVGNSPIFGTLYRCGCTMPFCPATGKAHQLYEHAQAIWCRTCRQKIETCCEGGG